MASLLISSKAKVAGRVSQTIRFYATPSTGSRKPTETSDPKKDVIRRALYPANIRSRASPTGTWRPDVSRALTIAIPSVQAHNTIERAWLLHQRHIRKKRDAELARKFECMRRAMEELEKIDPRLYMEANKAEDPRGRTSAEIQEAANLSDLQKKVLDARIRGLFPRELRIPTETPSRTGWNYEWQPFPRPL